MSKKIEITGTIWKDERNQEIRNLVDAFGFEIDNFPGSFPLELKIIQKVERSGENWKKLIYLEIINQVNRIVRERRKNGNLGSFSIGFNFVASCVYSSKFGVKFKHKKTRTP